MQSTRTFLYLIVSSSLCVVQVQAEVPFLPGEELTYSLSWGLIPVGSATMRVLPNKIFNGESCQVLQFKVQTNSFADAFYKVRTTVESIVDQNFKKSLYYKKSQREGSTVREIEVEFDYKLMKCRYYEGDQIRSEISIPGEAFDPLAIAYHFRFNQLTPNFTKSLPTCDGRRYREIIVTTGKRERVSVPAGKFWAFGTIPEMQNLSGVFKKSPDGILRVWYSDDSRRIPVKISSKVVVGSFKARLETTSGLTQP